TLCGSFFFFSSRRRHTRCLSDWSSDVCSSDLDPAGMGITVAEFDSHTGTLSAPRMIMPTRDPAHFTLSADGRHLYMCNTGTPGRSEERRVGKERRWRWSP